MKIEDQVVSLDLSRSLQEIGTEEESLFFWAKDKEHGYIVIPREEAALLNDEEIYHAFTVSELSEMLPGFIDTPLVGVKMVLVIGQPIDWNVQYRAKGSSLVMHSAETLADAMAKMLLYLITEGILQT